MKKIFLLSAVILGIFNFGTLAKAEVLPIIRINDINRQAFRSETKPVTVFDEKLKKLINDMIDTMNSMENCYGLAAPQTGRNLKIFVAQLDESGFQEFINPQILEQSAETSLWLEGCLSIPDTYGIVRRPCAVKVQAFDKNGKKFVLKVKNLDARIILHEIDHLNKTLFTDVAEISENVQGLSMEQMKNRLRESIKIVTNNVFEALHLNSIMPLTGI